MSFSKEIERYILFQYINPDTFHVPIGQQEPSNPFIEDQEPIEDEDALNPFTSGGHGRSSEKVNSNQ